MSHWPLTVIPAGAPRTAEAGAGARDGASVSAGVGTGLGLAALATMIGAIGTPAFAQAALQGINQLPLRAASWSVYQVWRNQPPRLHVSASLGIADTTRDCFEVYRQDLYRLDRSFDAVQRGQAGVLRMHADEAPSHLHRDTIYRRHGMLERLSVAQRGPDDSVLAVNLYHHEHQGRFAEGEIAGFAELAPLLLAAVQRHVELAGGQGGAAAATGAATGAGTGARTGATAGPAPAAPLRAALVARCPALTMRELDVCERLLRGWTYDGIAADLGLSVTTVKTYRARAFDRLGLHFKSELFAAFMPRH